MTTTTQSFECHDSAECAPHRYQYARQRDVLFGAGCGLLCFGLFPFSALAKTGVDKHEASSQFDSLARSLSATFAMLGFACLLLACVEIPRAKLRVALMAVLVPLAATVALGGATILHAAHATDVVSVLRHTRVLPLDQELRIQDAVNHLYCHAQTRTLCRKQDIEDAAMVLGLASQSQMEAVCAHTQGNDMDLFALDPLALIRDPTRDVMHWCGQYVTTPTDDGALDGTQSPYQQHHIEVIDALLLARTRRSARAKLLMVLAWFATPAFVAIVWWLHSLSVKIHASASAMV